MAKMELTDAQRCAVDNRGGSLLVSAAAGSGKTKVLVERLFAHMAEQGCNVDDFLIITYTKAAAAEPDGSALSAAGSAEPPATRCQKLRTSVRSFYFFRNALMNL